MNPKGNALFSVFDRLLPWFFLGILLFYTYANITGHASGIRWGTSGIILYVFEEQPEPSFHQGDRIIQIGNVTWKEFKQDLRTTFFAGAKPGDIIPSTVERHGRPVDIRWVYPDGPSGSAIMDQLLSEWLFACFFWLAGVFTVYVVRPKDASWLLMVLFNFLTATWLVAGSGPAIYHAGYGAIVFRVAIWLAAPVYLHLHWVFPQPLGHLPRWLGVLGYGFAVCLAIAQAFQLLPNQLYLIAFLLAVGGSLFLLMAHLRRQPFIRRNFRLPLLVLILAVIPPLVWAAIYSLVGLPSSVGGVGLLSLLLLPLAYLYAAFRRRLGTLELRVNRFFTRVIFIILLAVVGLPLIALADVTLNTPNKAIVIGSVAAFVSTIVCLRGYPVFESLMDRYVLGVPSTSKRLLEKFATQITTSVSLAELIRVLQNDVFPSLLIRQFAFLQYEQGSLTALAAKDVPAEQMPRPQDIPEFLGRSGFYRSPNSQATDHPHAWIRLVLQLRLGDQLLGFWLLGRRDPDDLYSQQEIPILSSLANLAAIALSNILQTERLKAMYALNVVRYEEERLRLAHDLHDSILNEMAALPIRRDAPMVSPEFGEAYQTLTHRLREIVDGLRPPLLEFGLKLSLEDLAEDLAERNQNTVEILTAFEADAEVHHPEVVENNLYRIVQEACENSLRHARPRKILISGRVSQNEIHINVQDDGIGLDPEISTKLKDLLINKHYGLAGMFERAHLIGAELAVHSAPDQGTGIEILWKSNEATDHSLGPLQ